MTKKLRGQLKDSTSTGGPTGPVSGITNENYTDKGKDFIKNNGGMGFVLTPHVYFTTPGGHVVEGPTHEEITAWRIYYARKGFRQKQMGRRSVATGSIMMDFMNKFGSWTVPTQWPWDFDRDYNRDTGVIQLRPRRDLDDPIDDPLD